MLAGTEHWVRPWSSRCFDYHKHRDRGGSKTRTVVGHIQIQENILQRRLVAFDGVLKYVAQQCFVRVSEVHASDISKLETG